MHFPLNTQLMECNQAFGDLLIVKIMAVVILQSVMTLCTMKTLASSYTWSRVSQSGFHASHQVSFPRLLCVHIIMRNMMGTHSFQDGSHLSLIVFREAKPAATE